MAHIFDVTAAGDSVSLGPTGTGEVPFTVTNVSASAVRGRAVFGPEKSAVLPWLKLMGEQERLLQPKQTDTFLVKVAVPPGSNPGDYSFRLDIVSVARPDEDSTQGPAIKIPVILAPLSPKPFPWWILVVAAVVIGGISFAALKLIPGSKAAVPDLHGKTVEQAEALLTPLHLKLGTQTKTPADKENVDRIVGQTPAYDSKTPTLVSPGTIVNVQVGVAKAEPPPPPAPAPVAPGQPEVPPIGSVVVPGVKGGTLHDAIIAVAQKGLTPILHLIAPRPSSSSAGATIGGIAGSRPRAATAASDVVVGQFPPEGTVVQGGTAVMITTATDDPAKVGTFVELPLGEGTPKVIDGSVAWRMAGRPDRAPQAPQ